MSQEKTFGFFLPEEAVAELIKALEKDGYNVTRIGNHLTAKNKPKPKDNTKYLTRGEVAKILQISLPTLHEYTKQGLITSYRIGSKVRYKQEDVEAALTQRNFGRKGGNHAA